MTFPSQESLKKIYLSILDGHLSPFKKEVRGLANTLTDCTMELYSKIVHSLPPTPSKFHYIFNLRDLSRIYHGLCLSTPDRFDDVSQFVRVWRNECSRVFYDRLINDKDKELVQVPKMNDIFTYFIDYTFPNCNLLFERKRTGRQAQMLNLC